LFAKIAQISDLFAFPNFRKVGKFVASIECLKTKSASASEGFAHLIRALPLDPAGGCAQTSVIGSRYRARHGAVPPDMAG